MMRYRAVLAAGVLLGALLTGVGAGISFGEYSSLHYLGEKTLGRDHIVTEEYRVSRNPEQDFSIELYGGRRDEVQIVIDDTLPEDELVFVLSYNEKALNPNVHREEWEDGEEQFIIDAYDMGMDEVIWEEKDELLENLKNRSFYTYRLSYWEEVTVRMSPAARERLKL